MNFGFIDLYVDLFPERELVMFSFFTGSRSVLQLSKALIAMHISC